MDGDIVGNVTQCVKRVSRRRNSGHEYFSRAQTCSRNKKRSFNLVGESSRMEHLGS